ncbi:MAG: extracellular solute-binding protein [Bacillota bacterium]|nr:extracellular solute-binding protein [Bacillota bacterium]
MADRTRKARGRRGGSARLAVLLVALLLAGCGGAAGTTRGGAGDSARGAGGGPSGSGAPPCQGQTVQVAYAASLVNLMEHRVRPAFEKATGCRFRGYPGGSKGLAQQIRSGLKRVDVFVSASPSVNRQLMGNEGGQRLRWYAVFAEAPLLIGYSPSSRFASELKNRPWYEVMAEPGFRLGRTDPRIDPKGELTIRLVEAAARRYGRPDLVRRLLGSPENPEQIFPEEELLGRIEAGQLDAGFFYANEAKEAGLPTLSVDPAIRLKAVYSFALMEQAPDRQAGIAFLRWLEGDGGRRALEEDGLQVLRPELHGDRTAVPAELAQLLGAGS